MSNDSLISQKEYCGSTPASISMSISIIYLPSGTRGVVAQSPEPEAHDKSD